MADLTPSEMARLTRPSGAPPGWAVEMDPDRKRLNDAAASARFLGGFFAVLGCLPLVVAYLGRWAQWWVQLVAVFDTLVLVGPGVWYFVACMWLRRYQRWAVVVTRRVAYVQTGLIGVMLGVTVWWGPSVKFVLVPTVLSVFFLPALWAMVYQMRKAELALNSLAPTESAFRPVVVEPSAVVVQPIESLRGK